MSKLRFIPFAPYMFCLERSTQVLSGGPVLNFQAFEVEEIRLDKGFERLNIHHDIASVKV